MTITNKDIETANAAVKANIDTVRNSMLDLLEQAIRTCEHVRDDLQQKNPSLTNDEVSEMVQILHANQLAVVTGTLGAYIGAIDEGTVTSLRRQLQSILQGGESAHARIAPLLTVLMPMLKPASA